MAASDSRYRQPIIIARQRRGKRPIVARGLALRRRSTASAAQVRPHPLTLTGLDPPCSRIRCWIHPLKAGGRRQAEPCRRLRLPLYFDECGGRYRGMAEMDESRRPGCQQILCRETQPPDRMVNPQPTPLGAPPLVLEQPLPGIASILAECLGRLHRKPASRRPDRGQQADRCHQHRDE